MKRSNLFRLLGVILAFAGITSCSDDVVTLEEQNEIVSVEEGEKEEVTFDASFEDVTEEPIDGDLSTRTILRVGNTTIWGANDAISVWMNGEMEKFVTVAGGERAVFEGLATAMSSLGNAYALFPYNEEATLSGTTITTTLNADQKAYENSFDIHSSVAVSQLSASEGEAGGLFYQVGAFIRFYISTKYEGEDVVSVTFSGRNNEALAGDMNINITNVTNPVGTITGNGKTSVTISAEGTRDGKLRNDSTSYVFIIAPQTLTNGFTVTLTSKTGKTCTFESSRSNTLERAVVKNLGALHPVWGKDYDDEGDHWVVYTAKGLYDWATQVNGGDFYTDKYGEGDTDLGLVLGSDIDLDDYVYNGAWKPVCSQAHPYEGVIDGKGYTIKNMEIKNREHPTHQGFLGWMDENSSIKDFNFENPKIISDMKGTNDNSRDDDSYVGVLVGAMNTKGEFTTYQSAAITNCHVTNGSVTGGEGVGGLIGRSFATRDIITNCSYSGSVNGIMFVGGIIGSNEGFMTNCHFNGTVTFDEDRATGVGRIGGISGSNNSAGIIGCTAQGTVNGSGGEYVGGIVGGNNGQLYGCASAVTVNGKNGGAIAGVTLGTMGASYACGTSASYGIVWWVEDNGIVDNCYTTLSGTVSGNKDLSSYVVDDVSSCMQQMNSVLSDITLSAPYVESWEFVTNDGTIVESSVFPIIAVQKQQ